jgi:uncharacterized protein (DUF2384 family)
MTNDEKISPDAVANLQARFQQQSRKAQAYYNVMHAARTVAGSDEAASNWMNEPLAALGGKTPAELVSAGREDEVLGYARALKP